MKKRLILIALTLIFLINLASCSKSQGIDIGFNGFLIGQLPQVHFGVKSDKNVFNIDDVTLNFSYGDSSSAVAGGFVGENDGEDCPVVCIAVYFFNSEYSDVCVSFGDARFEDYTKIEHLYFVKEISLYDYNENYDVDNNALRRKYEHSEDMTIPVGVFEGKSGYVCLGVYQIAYVPSTELYIIVGGGKVALKYEILDNGTVKLSEADRTI